MVDGVLLKEWAFIRVNVVSHVIGVRAIFMSTQQKNIWGGGIN